MLHISMLHISIMYISMLHISMLHISMLHTSTHPCPDLPPTLGATVHFGDQSCSYGRTYYGLRSHNAQSHDGRQLPGRR